MSSTDFPRRMFAIGDEPLGIRVTPYHKPKIISKIIKALEEEEIALIKQSPFGKLLTIEEKPSFSGRFGRFIMSRQLKTRKKYEIWFLFAGKPVRFSLREFSIVTGLNCNRFPPQSKKRSNKTMSSRPYWGELFGTMTEVPSSHVISMLKKKTVTDPDLRIKYAYLALLSAVLLPTSHNPRILHGAAEKIKDLNTFLSYPWGRVAFELLIGSIKERNEVSLSQNTIAFKGFVMALQLVMIEAVPSLTGVVRDGGSSGSEGDSAEEDHDFVSDGEEKKSINTFRIRDIDAACKAVVISIIPAGDDEIVPDSECVWSDEEEDVQVDNLLNSIQQGFCFSKSHFTGGATFADVILMRDEAKRDNLSRKTSKSNPKPPLSPHVDADLVSNIVKNIVSSEMLTISQGIKDLTDAVNNSQLTLLKSVQDALDVFRIDIAKLLCTACNRPHVPTPTEPEPVNISTCNGLFDDLEFDGGVVGRDGDIQSNPSAHVTVPLPTTEEVVDVRDGDIQSNLSANVTVSGYRVVPGMTKLSSIASPVGYVLHKT